jgi:hypothetical protein
MRAPDASFNVVRLFELCSVREIIQIMRIVSSWRVYRLFAMASAFPERQSRVVIESQVRNLASECCGKCGKLAIQ